jgi:signal transduction histidine kinase
VKFTEPYGSILVTTSVNNSCVLIKVIDTGVGINKEKIEQLFIKDMKTSTMGTNGEKGTGLGLLLCKELIELNKGEIKIESEIGKGSTFTIIFERPDSL